MGILEYLQEACVKNVHVQGIPLVVVLTTLGRPICGPVQYCICIIYKDTTLNRGVADTSYVSLLT